MYSSSFASIDPSMINPSWRIAIVRSRWHSECTDALNADAVTALKKYGIKPANIVEVIAPGSFEIPLLCRQIIESRKADAIIAFGVIVEGETHHARLIAEESARAIMDLQMKTGVPVTFEILYVDDIADAVKRSTGRGAKGALSAETALNTLAGLRDLR